MSNAVSTDDGVRRLPRNAVFSGASLVLPIGLAILTTPFVLARLGEEAFGLYLVSLSAAGLVGLFELGLGTAGVRFLAEARARGDAAGFSCLVNTLLSVRVPQAVAIASLGAWITPFLCERLLRIPGHLQPDAAFAVRVSIASACMGLIAGSLAALPRSLHRYDIANGITTLQGLLLTGGTVGLVALGHGVRQIVVLELCLGAASLAANAAVATHLVPEWRPTLRIHYPSLRELMAFGGLSSLNTLAGFTFLHLNRILITRALGVAVVPFFAIPWGLCARVSQLVSALTDALAPVATTLAARQSESALKVVYARATVLTTVAAASLLVPLGVAAPDLLSLWLGRDFGDAAGAVLRLLTLAATLQSLSAVPYGVLTGIGLAARANAPTLAAALLSAGLAAGLLPSHGLEGLALGMIVAMAVQAALLIMAAEEALASRGITLRELARPLTASAAGAALGIVVGRQIDAALPRLIVSCASAVAVQQALLLATRCYGAREARMLAAAVMPPPRVDARRVRGSH